MFQNNNVLLGLNMALGIGLFSFAGHWVDEKRGTSPWGILGGMFVGLCYAGYELWKFIQQMNKH